MSMYVLMDPLPRHACLGSMEDRFRARSRSEGLPYPPPPGVFTIMRSPASILAVFLPPKLMTREIEFPLASFTWRIHKFQSTLRVMSLMQAVWVIYPPFRENADGHGNAEFNIADHTVSSTMLSSSTRSLANREFAENNRVATLEYLQICDARICHVGVHARLSIEIFPGATTACNLHVRAISYNSHSFIVPKSRAYASSRRVLATRTKR